MGKTVCGYPCPAKLPQSHLGSVRRTALINTEVALRMEMTPLEGQPWICIRCHHYNDGKKAVCGGKDNAIRCLKERSKCGIRIVDTKSKG